jgi:hypothetical protein
MRILVELDAIMDTRLPVVASIDPEAAANLVQSKAYYFRSTDNFNDITNIDHQVYLNAYQHRHDEHVIHSRITNIVLMLRELTYHLREMARSEPMDQLLRVDINIYPYHLSDFRDEIASAVTAHCSPETLVSTVSISPEDVTPVMLKRDYNAFIVYNFDEWFSKHALVFEKFSMPRVTVFAPALYKVSEPTWDQDDIKNLSEHDPFSLLEDTMLFFMRLQFLDAKDFSILQYWELPEKNA